MLGPSAGAPLWLAAHQNAARLAVKEKTCDPFLPSCVLKPQKRGTRKDGMGLTSRKGTMKLVGWPGLGSLDAWCSNMMPFPCSTTSGCLCRGAELGRGHWVMVKRSSPP